jgi:predicted PurR-regulated permease PerM
LDFSFERFYDQNKRVLIWLCFFWGLWLMRGYMDILFLVFVLCYLTGPVSKLLQKYLRLRHYVATTLVFLAVLFGGGVFFQYVTPLLVKEVESVVANAGKLEAGVVNLQNSLARRYPVVAEVAISSLRDSVPDAVEALWLKEHPDSQKVPDDALPRLYMGVLIEKLHLFTPQIMVFVWHATGTVFISLLFAYLISLDTARLRAEVAGLRRSRLKHFHEETATAIVNFANTVGRALQAQFLIACINTVLTTLCLLFLGLPAVTVLAVIVFFCSFIPVLGVFISTTPLVIVALGTGELLMAVWVVLLIIVIHAIEAYGLNPLIYGRHLQLNPVLVLFILYIGHRAFGVWGMLLGVPVAHYLMRHVLDIQTEPDRQSDGKETAHES